MDEHSRGVILKSANPVRIADNFDVFDFELSRGRMAAIDALDTEVRGGAEPDTIAVENYDPPIPKA